MVTERRRSCQVCDLYIFILLPHAIKTFFFNLKISVLLNFLLRLFIIVGNCGIGEHNSPNPIYKS